MTCAIERQGGGLNLVYRVSAERGVLLLPASVPAVRTDGLWRTTCMELFVGQPGERYAEYNFAPSGAWAAYRFAARRDGIAPLDGIDAPTIRLVEGDAETIVSVALPQIPPDARRLGITAVIEERCGTRSFWALRHGGDVPDFHDPDCFVLELPPAH
ncbi:DOMON-like domain-containing protein [Sphingomonas sp. RS6]